MNSKTKPMQECAGLLAACAVLLAAMPVHAACNASMQRTKPDSIYQVHGDGTVTDAETGLMWQACTLGLSGATCATGTATGYSWKTALEVAQTANAGAGTFGYTDWRLPNTAELGSLAEKACYSPAINPVVFPNTQNARYWASSTYALNNTSAWQVSFGNGVEYSGTKSDSFYHVRLVRGGN